MRGTVRYYTDTNTLECVFAGDFAQQSVHRFCEIIKQDESATGEQCYTIMIHLAALESAAHYFKWHGSELISMLLAKYLDTFESDASLDDNVSALTNRVFGLFRSLDYRGIDELVHEVFSLHKHQAGSSNFLDAWLSSFLLPLLNNEVFVEGSSALSSHSSVVDIFKKRAVVEWLMPRMTNLALLIDIREFSGNSVLDFCAMHCLPKAISSLLEAGASKDNADDLGDLPFHNLAYPHVLYNHEAAYPKDSVAFMRAIDLLMPAGGVDVKNKDGRTLFALLVRHGAHLSSDIFDALISRGADRNTIDLEKRTPLHALGNMDIVPTELVRYIAGLYPAEAWVVEDKAGHTPMHCIAVENHFLMARFLLEELSIPLKMNAKALWPSDCLPEEASDEFKALLKTHERLSQDAAKQVMPAQDENRQVMSAMLRLEGLFRDGFSRLETSVGMLGSRMTVAEGRLAALEAQQGRDAMDESPDRRSGPTAS